MAYGTIKVDNIVFTNAGSDQTITVSGLVASTSGNLTVTGTISGNTIQGQTVSGVTVTGTTANFTSGNFTTFTGGTITLTSGVIASGTAANPSLSILGDANTGLYSPGADQLAISTGGSGRLFVDASGNVGVGTNDTANAFVTLTNQDVSLRLNPVTGSASITAVQTGVAFRDLTIGSNQTIFQTAATERLRITSAGLVGVGTSAPGQNITVQSSASGTAPTFKLQNPVDSNSSQGAANNLSAGQLLFGATGSYPLTAKIESVYNADASFGRIAKLIISGANGSGTLTERLTIDEGGRVGVGTTSPDAKLLVSDGTNINTRIGQLSLDNFTGEGAGIRFSRTTSDDSLCALGTLNAGDGDLGLFSRNSLIFATGGASNYSATTERARIDSSGRLGIGTSSPSSQLHCTGDIKFGDAITLSRSISTGLVTITDPTAEPYTQGFAFRTNETDEAYRFQNGDGTATYLTIRGSGNVGIGTTSAGATLDVAGDIRSNARGTSFGFKLPDWRVYNSSSGNALVIDNYATEALRVDSSNRLLVGTSSAQGDFTLQIQGDAASSNAAGSIYLRRGLNTAAIGGNVGADLGSIDFGANDGTIAGRIECLSDATWSSTSDTPGRLVFSTTADGASSPTERMRITSAGSILSFAASANDAITAGVASGAGATPYLFAGVHSRTGTATGGTLSYSVAANGNVQNTNGSYTTISDAKLKENIVDAGSQWDDLKAIQIRNWNFKAETGHETHRQIGPIAQELETVCPGLVFETPDRDEDGNETSEVTKGVNQSVLYMKAVKALQEAMDRIEQLEQRLTDAGIA